MKLFTKKVALLIAVISVICIFAASALSAGAAQRPPVTPAPGDGPSKGYYSNVNTTARINEAVADDNPITVMNLGATINSTTSLALSGEREFVINFNGYALIFRPTGFGISLGDKTSLTLDGRDSNGDRIPGSRLYVMGGPTGVGISTTGTKAWWTGQKFNVIRDNSGVPSVEIIYIVDGWNWIEGNYYYYVNGVMQTGWIQHDGKWYYCEPNAKGSEQRRYDGRYETFPMGARWEGVWLKSTNNLWYFFHDGYTAWDATSKLPARSKITIDAGEMAVTYWLSSHDGFWYYFGTNGTMETNQWIKSGTKWFYLGSDGKMFADKWVKYGQDWYYLKADGAMAANEIITWKGNEYFFRSGGAMVANQWVTINNAPYYFKASGAMAKNGWERIGSAWYYFASDGRRFSNTTITEKGVTYRLGSNGVLLTNQWWQDKNTGAWYYYKPGGAEARSEWVKYGQDWYYLKADGVMAANETITWNGNDYHFRSGGAMVANRWYNIKNSWYYFKSSGAMAKNEWISSGGNWYYTGRDGKMIANDSYETSRGRFYFFNSGGAMVRDQWRMTNGVNYYYGSDGARVSSSWVESITSSGRKWSYIGADGQAVTNKEVRIDGNWYYFDANGYMFVGLRNDGSNHYYYGSNGVKFVSRWFNSPANSKNWYYFGSDGARYKNQWLDNTYYFDANGVMLYSTTRTIGGLRCTFGSDGKLISKVPLAP